MVSAAPEKAELRVGLAEEFAERCARRHSRARKLPVTRPGRLSAPERTSNAEHDEQHQAFERRFIELARMARERAAVGEDHRPGHVGRPAPQFAIDEIGDAAEEQADRRRPRVVTSPSESIGMPRRSANSTMATTQPRKPP